MPDSRHATIATRDSKARSPLIIRLACHVAGAAPFLLAAGIEMSRVWRPSGDDANIAFRSWEVFSFHSPLVGQAVLTSGHSRVAYDLGPLLYWFLAIPVHLDPSQGALWGAAVLCAVAVSIAVEAAWSARGWPAAVAVVAVVLTIVAERPTVALDPTWNPNIGLIWFFCTAALAWSVAVGHLRWWPVLVVAASFAAQCHLAYVLGAVGCVVVAPLMGGLRTRTLGRWLPVGLLAGLACWIAPLLQQLTAPVGNLSALMHVRGGGHVAGTTFGLRSLEAAIVPVPIWWGRPSVNNIFVVIGTIGSRSAALGVMILVGLVLIGVVAWFSSRRDLSALAVIALVLSLSVVITFSSLPASELLSILYIDPMSWPVGMIVLLVGAISLAELLMSTAHRLATRRGTHGAGIGRDIPARLRRRRVLAPVVLVLGIVATASNVLMARDVRSDNSGRWKNVSNVRLVTAEIEHAVRRGRVEVVPAVGGGFNEYGLMCGVLWDLRADGWQPTTTSWYVMFIGPEVASTRPVPFLQVAVDDKPGKASIGFLRTIQPGRSGRPSGPQTVGRDATAGLLHNERAHGADHART